MTTLWARVFRFAGRISLMAAGGSSRATRAAAQSSNSIVRVLLSPSPRERQSFVADQNPCDAQEAAMFLLAWGSRIRVSRL
jgi:hypothetical protein